MAAHPVLQRLLEWREEKLLKHGGTKLVPLKRGQKERLVYPLAATNAARALNYAQYSPDSKWRRCVSVSATDSTLITGRISEILAAETGPVVVLELFQVRSVRDELYGMPVAAAGRVA
ncbi:hypothetical protein FB451DRAFT_1400730 [Mycena latifolia]|nr:hypothetical protein FB451DRAFT_1400730 [Mycena latifolia]